MKTESGSTRMLRPMSKSPAVSQLQRVDECERSSGRSPTRAMNVASAATKETRTESVVR
jgi:hypothetical protein